MSEVSVGLKFINHPQVHTDRYEDLISLHKVELKIICQFMGIKYLKSLIHILNLLQFNQIALGSILQSKSMRQMSKNGNHKNIIRLSKKLLELPVAEKLFKNFNYIYHHLEL